MMKPWTSNIDCFCPKLSQSNLEALLKISVSISVLLSTGQGLGQVTKGHERSSKSKILFSGMRHMSCHMSARRIQISKPFFNLTPRKSTTKKGQVNPGSHKVKFSNCYFRTKKSCFWTSLISGFKKKCHFYFCEMSRNAPNRILRKMTSSADMVFGLYVCQK